MIFMRRLRSSRSRQTSVSQCLRQQRGCRKGEAGVAKGVADETITLWRPVGPNELALIEAARMRAFPA
jgi:hypothetical protein